MDTLYATKANGHRIQETPEYSRTCSLKITPERSFVSPSLFGDWRQRYDEGAVKQIASCCNLADAVEDDGPLCVEDLLF